ncbi:MAG: diguanylate cyclase [Proteobacteria bacterium]|nr:diguanylate cyclase [Pseudomonadota bacterium]
MAEFADAKVLIVDDSRFDREMAREALASSVRVECCEHGAAALASLQQEPADIVVSDITMPGMSGVELLERIRREHPGTDVILLTASPTVDTAVQALRMGATDYMMKPIHAEQLERVIEQTLSRRRLLEENRRLRDAMRTVEACNSLTSVLEPGEVYAAALDLLLNCLSRLRGLAVFHRTSLPAQDAVAFRGLSEAEARDLRQILVEDKPVDVESLDRIELVDRSPVHEALRSVGLPAQTLMAVPIQGREGEAGILWIFEDGRRFESDEFERAAIVRGYAAAALRNAERYHQAKERAFHDDVTEVYNARYLLGATENEIRRAERYKQELSVLFLDLDRFKLVNDRFGHLVGSQTLRELSQLLLQCVRQVDVLARYGGDEFTIILVDTGHEEALVIAERIRRTVEEHVFEAGRDATLRLTVSIGVATFPEHGRQRDPILDSADKAMYWAKSRGRNRVGSAARLED